MKHNIALIGSGQLGSRHLQAIVKEPQCFSIDVVEPTIEAQNVSRERLSQVQLGHPETTVTFHKELSDLKGDYSVAVVATGAANRAGIVTELIEKIGIRRIILEKVLFQNLVDYTRIGDLISLRGAKAWVNCPRRIYPGWKKIRDSLENPGLISLSVSGGDWGLACNAIHFIDLAVFLGCDKELDYSTTALDGMWISSKRPGYREITGLLTAKSRRGDRLSLFSGTGYNTPPLVTIDVPGARYLINESTCSYLSSKIENNWAWKEDVFPIKYQSELTGELVASILAEDTCSLTPFEESAHLHIGLIAALIDHYDPFVNRISGILPIT